MARERAEKQANHELSDRKIRDAKIKDFVILLPIQEFTVQPPVPKCPTAQPLALIAAALPFINRRHISDLGLDKCELVMVDQGEGQDPRLALQLVTRTAVAREYVDPIRQEALANNLRQQFPRDYVRLSADVRTDDSQSPVITNPDRPELAWWEVSNMEHRNEEFNVLSHIIGQAPSGQVRIEVHTAHHVEVGRDTHGYNVYRDRLLSETYHCNLVELDGRRAIKIVAHLPLFVATSQEVRPQQFVDTTFFVFEDRVVIPDDEMFAMTSQRKEHGLDQSQRDSSLETIQRDIKKHWHQITGPLIHRRGQRWTRKHGITVPEYRRPVQYSVRGFDQEVMQQGYGSHEDISIRIFDAADVRQTVRPEDEVRRKLYMSVKDAEEADRRDEAFEIRWATEILPGCRDWSEEGIEEARRYIQAHRMDSVELVRDKLAAGIRLIVLGITIHPLMDDLPVRLLDNLPIDFVALEVRKPDDPVRVLDEQTVFGEVDLGRGRFLEMDPEMAKRAFPEQYRDPAKPMHIWDGLLGRARIKGIEMIPVLSGKNWKELNQGISDNLVTYLGEHPDARGIYFASLLHCLAWPGYRNQRELQKLNSNRPFIDVYSLAKAYLSDPKVRMPTFVLKQQFPEQVYNTAQFAMPTGFGAEWRNLRAAVGASGAKERFALDNIVGSPFAEQWYLSDPFHVQEAGMPDEELYKATMPINIKWGELLDGVVVYP